MQNASLSLLAAGLFLSVPCGAAPAISAAVLPAALAAPVQSDIDFAGMAEDLLKRHKVGDALASTFDFEAFLNGEFVRLRVGLFDLHMEASTAVDKKSAEEFKDVAEAMLGAQEVWLDWTRPISKDQTQVRKDLAVLQDFVKGLRGAGIAKALKGGSTGDVFELLSERDSTREAAESFASFMASGACLGLEREIRREPTVIVPERRRFIEFLAFAGWLRPELQDRYWHESVVGWTNTYIDEYRFLALRLPAMDGSREGYSKGESMNARTGNGLQQQMSQLAALSMVDNYYGDAVPPALAGGLSVMLTVDQFGECNTKVDGDLRERRTHAYEMFVPGGQSEGGILAPNYADSRWRKKQGKEYFTGVLKLAQKAGAKEAKRLKGKYRHFELQNDDKNKRTLVSGPFLGSKAADISGINDMYEGDKAEFLRAYRTAFLHFLRTAGAGKQKPSQAAFSSWLGALAAPGPDDDLETITKRIFGADLSDAEPGKETLEGRFLAWISKS